jgi:hypothetical protein
VGENLALIGIDPYDYEGEIFSHMHTKRSPTQSDMYQSLC